jgi:hypothetical protein
LAIAFTANTPLPCTPDWRTVTLRELIERILDNESVWGESSRAQRLRDEKKRGGLWGAAFMCIEHVCSMHESLSYTPAALYLNTSRVG